MKTLLALLLVAACSPHLSLSDTAQDVTTVDDAASGGGTSGTGPRSASITAAAGDLLVAFASVSANSQAAPTMTDSNGGTYSLVGRAAWQTSNNMLCFVRDSLLPNAIPTTLTLNTDTNTAGEIVILAYTGISRAGSAAIKQFASQANQPANATPSVTFAAPVTVGDAVVASVASSDTATQEPNGWSERKDVHQATPTTALEVATKNKLTGATITYGAFESFGYAAMGLELDASAISPPVDAGVADAPLIADAVIDGSPTRRPSTRRPSTRPPTRPAQMPRPTPGRSASLTASSLRSMATGRHRRRSPRTRRARAARSCS